MAEADAENASLVPMLPAVFLPGDRAAMGKVPAILVRAGARALFAAQEFFFGTIRNEHTRRAYLHAVKLFLSWIEKHAGASLRGSLPGTWVITLRSWRK